MKRIRTAPYRVMTAAACAAGFACTDGAQQDSKINATRPNQGIVTADFVGHVSASGMKIVPMDRVDELGASAKGLIRELDVVIDGRTGVNPPNTIEVRNASDIFVNDPEACQGHEVSYCADIAAQNFWNKRIRRTAIQIKMLAPSAGRAALNSDEFGPEFAARFGNTPGNTLGFWTYDGPAGGTLAPGETSIRRIVFDNTASGDFVFLARFVGEVYDETCPDQDLGSALGAVASGSTAGGFDDSSPSCGSDGGAADLSFSWTAPSTGRFNVDTVGSNFDTVLTIKDGTCSGPGLGCDDDIAPGNTASQVGIDAVGGQTYIIVVDGFGSRTGDFVLNINEDLCGNGTVNTGEQCDDGNRSGGDGCDANCQIETFCGDGIVGGTEECDDGNTTDGDGCDQFCTVEPVCGNTLLERGESCDDGNTTAGDGCSDTCQIEGVCPVADLGSAEGNIANGTTVGMADLFDPPCGGTNNTAGDAGYLWTAPRAGEWILDTAGSDFDTALWILGANCGGDSLACNDDGIAPQSRVVTTLAAGQLVTIVVDGFNASSGNYSLNVRQVVCGDGTMEGSETCDDGNTNAGDGCSDTCSLELLCGNGVIQLGEQCDDGNIIPGDGCSDTCLVETLGQYLFPETGGVFVFEDNAIIPGDNRDAFSLVMNQAGLFTAETFEDALAGTCDTADTVIRVFDASMNQVTSNDEAGINSCSLISNFRLEPGIYFVTVEDFLRDTEIPVYDLLMNATPADVCGNTVVEAGEQCDDGNTATGDGCSDTCQFEQTCGNNAIEGTETCDDGNTTAGDGCSDTCQVELICPNSDLGSAVGTSVATGTTVGQDDTFTPSCSFGNSPDVTFTWMAPADGSFTFSTAGSAYDTVVYLLDAVCGGNELVCDDDVSFPTDATSEVTTTLTNGQTVTIVVDGYDGAAGDFILNIAQN